MNNQAQLVGIFKRTFANKILDLTKNENPLLDSIPFENKIGEQFQQPVDLQMEQAFTAAINTVLPSGNTYGGYLDPIAGLTDRALVTPFSIHGRTSVTYNVLAEAAAAGEKAFASAAAHLVKRMTRSHAKRLEIQLLRGRRGIGVVESLSGSGTTRAIVITAASWAEGLWSGMAGARLDVYDGLGTQASPWLKTAQASAITVTSVNPATRTVNVSGTDGATGLNLAAAGTLLTFETATIAENAENTNEMPGVKFWARNTGALFNINASTQPLWAGNVYGDSVGTPSLSKFIDALTSPSSYGLMNAVSIAVISPRTLNTVISDQAALRRYPSSEKTGRNGFSYLEFNVQTGTLRMQPHAYQADGEFDIYCPDSASRVGALEIDFIQRNSGGDERLVLESATSPSGEMRTLSNQTLFCAMPRHIVTAAGVTY
jgi:hypothetical protein